MDLRDQRDAFLLAALPHVPFDGWSAPAMRHAARDLGQDATMPERLFPGGAIQLVEHFCDFADRRMIVGAAEVNLSALGVGRRVAAVVRLRLEQWAGEREAVRRAVSLLTLPIHGPLALRLAYRTVDAIWHAVGDTSTDFSYYTKRATLAAIYTATLLAWLEDRSDGAEDTWGFLDRRLAEAAGLPRLKGRLQQIAAGLPNPLRQLNRGPRRRFGLKT